jgi:hypothetical protein
MARSAKSFIFLLTGFIFIPPCLFFLYYTARLVYLNLTMEDAAAHRTGGMLIGAIAFPLAAIIFGLISVYCINKARRGFREK